MISRDKLAEEMLLREYVRKAIGVVAQRRKLRDAQTLKEEATLRRAIRQIIKEADPAVSTSAVHNNTGINALEDLFKNTNLLTVLRVGYKSLTSKKEQRDSYKNHILAAVEISLETEDSLWDTDEEFKGQLQELDLRPEFMKDLERAKKGELPPEQAKKIKAAQAAMQAKSDKAQSIDASSGLTDEEDDSLQEQEINIDVGAPEDNPAFIDVEEKEPSEEEEVEKFSIKGQDRTGRNRAFTDYKNVEKNILTAYDNLDDPTDREMFSDYLLTNLKLYFERFEEELSTELPEPDIEVPEDAEVEATEEEGGEEVDLEAEELLEWLVLTAMKN